MIGTSSRIVVASLFALGLAVSAPAWAQESETGHTTEPLVQVKAKVEAKKAILVDVRESREWDRGHVRGAVFLPLSQLSEWERDGVGEADRATLARSLPKGTVVYCHCAAGGRALSGAEVLRKLGYDARPLKPGYRDLVEAGFPAEAGK